VCESGCRTDFFGTVNWWVRLPIQALSRRLRSVQSSHEKWKHHSCAAPTFQSISTSLRFLCRSKLSTILSGPHHTSILPPHTRSSRIVCCDCRSQPAVDSRCCAIAETFATVENREPNTTTIAGCGSFGSVGELSRRCFAREASSQIDRK
jgi:hypothetical protein